MLVITKFIGRGNEEEEIIRSISINMENVNRVSRIYKKRSKNSQKKKRQKSNIFKDNEDKTERILKRETNVKNRKERTIDE